MASERLQKILAHVGIASRRKGEELIEFGEVTVNGKIAKLGDKADLSEDAIKVSGRLISKLTAPPVYYAFYKPRLVISMFQDPEGRATMAGYFARIKTRLFPIGRLSFNNEGLILVTNDGEFAEKLQRRDDIPRVYHVKVKGHPDEEMLTRLRRGVKQDGHFSKPLSVSLIEKYTQKSLVEIIMMGVSTVDMRSWFEDKGFLVERIVRTAIGHITLHGLEPGKFRPLKDTQVEALLHQPDLGMRKIDFETKKREAKQERTGISNPENAEIQNSSGLIKPLRARETRIKPVGSKSPRPRDRSADRVSAPKEIRRDSRGETRGEKRDDSSRAAPSSRYSKASRPFAPRDRKGDDDSRPSKGAPSSASPSAGGKRATFHGRAKTKEQPSSGDSRGGQRGDPKGGQRSDRRPSKGDSRPPKSSGPRKPRG